MQNTEKLIAECEKELCGQFARLERIAYTNQCKVMEAFQKNRVALRHFVGDERLRIRR